MKHGLNMGLPAIFVGRPVEFHGPAHGPAHVLSRTKRYRLTCLFLFLFLFWILVLIFSFYCFSFFFFLLDSVDQLLLAHTTPLPTTINTICTTNGPVRWLPSQMVDHHLLLLLLLLLLRLVLLRRPQQQHQ